MIDFVPGALILGRYRLLNLPPGSRPPIGGLLALDERLGRRVVLMRCPAPASTEQGRRFVARAEAAALIRHTAFPMIYDIAIHEEHPLLVRAHIAAPTLVETVGDIRHWPARRMVYLVARLAEGLGLAHAAGLAHGSLHKSAILLADDDLIVPDVAWPALQQAPQAWLAPEVRDGALPGPEADVFALGLLLRGLLDQADTAPSASLDAVVVRAMAWRPRDRPRNGTCLRREIDTALAAPHAPPAPAPLALTVSAFHAPSIPPAAPPSRTPAMPAPSTYRGQRRRHGFAFLFPAAALLVAALSWPSSSLSAHGMSGMAGAMLNRAERGLVHMGDSLHSLVDGPDGLHALIPPIQRIQRDLPVPGPRRPAPFPARGGPPGPPYSAGPGDLPHAHRHWGAWGGLFGPPGR